MPARQTCPKCGAAIIGEALDGLCPKCVAQLAFGSEPATTEPLGAPASLPASSENANLAGKDAGAPGPQQTIALSIPLTEKPGDRIGRYKLLQQIGEGGCGVVYMAEQEEPVRRRVALKVIKLGMD